MERRKANDLPRASHRSASAAALNVHAAEFVPKHEQVFRQAYPSLATSKSPKPIKPTTSTTTQPSFHAVATKPISVPLPAPPPAVPDGFVFLSKNAISSRADATVSATKDDEAPTPPNGSAAEPPRVVPATKRRHTKAHVTEWRAPLPAPQSPSPATTSQDDAGAQPAPAPVESALPAKKDARGRSPGYFFQVAAQAKVLGRQTNYDDEIGDKVEQRRHRVVAPRVQALDVPSTDADAPTAHSQVRDTYRAMAARVLRSVHLTPEDFVALTAHLTTHRALLLWDERDEERCNSWHLAAAHGHDSVLTLLHELGDGLEARDRKKFTPLHAAAANGHPSTVRLLLSLGASAAAVDKHGNTPFHIACREGHVAVVKLLLPKSKLDGRNRRRDTPLLLAVRSAATMQASSGDDKAFVQWMDVVRLLLVAGASPLVVNLDGHTPLYESLQTSQGSLTLAQELLVYGYPTPANTTNNGSAISPATRSVFYQAVCVGNAAAVELLAPVVPPSEWTSVDKTHGDSLLHAAVRHGHASDRSELLKVLLVASKHGRSLLAAENIALQTPLFLAIHLGDAAAVAGLLSHGGYPNERNRRNHSALFAAVRSHQFGCVRELISSGCSLDADCVAYVKAHTPVALPPLIAEKSTWMPPLRSADMQPVECTVGGDVDYAHSCVLVAHCPSIRAQLCGPWAVYAPHTAVAVALDTTKASWEYLKAYLYYGGISKLLCNAVCDNQADLDAVVELLVVANSLLLLDVQHVCCVILRQSLPRRDFRDVVASLGLDLASDAIAQTSYNDVVARAIDTWRHDRRQLLANQWLADATLIAERSQPSVSSHHACHRAVVAAASPILRAHFQSDRLPPAAFSLPFTSDTVAAVLEYMYTDTLANVMDLSVECVVDIVQASLALELAGCAVLCERALVHRVVQTGCDVDLLSVAESLQLEHLAGACRIHLLGTLPTDKTVLLSCFGRI